jgi:hypothetical protein
VFRVELVVGDSGRRQGPDGPVAGGWKRFPQVSEVPVAHTRSGCRES